MRIDWKPSGQAMASRPVVLVSVGGDFRSWIAGIMSETLSFATMQNGSVIVCSGASDVPVCWQKAAPEKRSAESSVEESVMVRKVRFRECAEVDGPASYRVPSGASP